MYQAVNDERAFTLNSAQTLSISEYEALKACSAWTQIPDRRARQVRT